MNPSTSCTTMRPSTTQDKKSSSTRSSSSAQKPKSGGGRPGPGPTFVSKLYKMLSDTDNARLITWTPVGDAFVVLRPSEFARKLLPTQYKHSQFQSFVRQANMYGFSKVTLPSALLSQLLAVGEPSNPSTAGSTRPATNLPSPAIGRVRTSTTTTTLVTDASAMPPVTSDAGHAPTSARDVPHAEAAALAFAPAAAAATAPAPAAVAAVLTRGAARGKTIGPDEQPWAFKHPKFLRGAVDLLPEVRRKARVRKLSMTGVHAGGGGGGPPEGVDVGGHAGNVLLSPNQKEMGYRSGATDGESGGDDADAPSPGHAGGYGEYDELDGEQSMSMSLSAGGYYEPRHASMSAASGGNFSLHHTHVDRGTVLHESASPRPHLDMNLNDPLSPRPHSDPYAAAAQYPAAPYPAHQLALAALPPPPPPPAPRSAPIADQYAGQGATSAAMFRLAELTSKLADMVTRSLPPEDAAGAASTAVRNEVTSIVSEAWGIANAFTGGDSAVGTAESATGSSADSPRAMRHHHFAWGYPSARPYRPASRAYPGYPSAGHYYGGVGGGPYARPPPYPPSARDAYLSPPYTAHPSFASRSPAEMYWPDPVHFPHSPSHPPAQFNGSSPAAAAQYAHQFPPSAGGAAAAAGAAAHAPLPAPARYHASPSAAVAAAGGPLSNLRYYSSAGTDGPDERGAEGERRQAPTAEDYELAMAQWH